MRALHCAKTHAWHGLLNVCVCALSSRHARGGGRRRRRRRTEQMVAGHTPEYCTCRSVPRHVFCLWRLLCLAAYRRLGRRFPLHDRRFPRPPRRSCPLKLPWPAHTMASSNPTVTSCPSSVPLLSPLSVSSPCLASCGFNASPRPLHFFTFGFLSRPLLQASFPRQRLML